MNTHTDILLDEDNKIIIRDNDFVIGDSRRQEVKLLLSLNQGDLKSDPILGPNLIQLIRAKKSEKVILSRLKLHLERDGKNWEDYKDKIKLK